LLQNSIKLAKYLQQNH